MNDHVYKTLSVSVKACVSHTMISLVFDSEQYNYKHASNGLGHCFCKKIAEVIIAQVTSKNIQELTLP